MDEGLGVPEVLPELDWDALELTEGVWLMLGVPEALPVRDTLAVDVALRD